MPITPQGNSSRWVRLSAATTRIPGPGSSALASGAFDRLKHSGNHVYLLGLDRRSRRHVGSITRTGREGYAKEWKLAA